MRICGHDDCWHVFKNRNYDRHFTTKHEERFLTVGAYAKDKGKIDQKIQQKKLELEKTASQKITLK